MRKKSFLILILCLFIFSIFSLAQYRQIKQVKKVELAIADLSVAISCPDLASAGEALGKNIKVVITNNGTITANDFFVDIILSSDTTAPVKFAVYSSNFSEDVLLKGGREHIKNLESKQSLNLELNGTNTIPSDTPSANYYLGVVVDSGNAVKEIREDNNTAFCRMKISGQESEELPDLIIEEISLKPNNPKTGEQIKFKAVVKNIGNASTPLSVAAIRVGGETYPKTYKIPPLASNSSYTIKRYEDLSVAQNYRTTAYADYKSGVAEVDETNNSKYVKFRVTEKGKPYMKKSSRKIIKVKKLKKKIPDLIVKDIQLVEGCKIKVTVKNIGTGGVPSSYYELPNAVGVQMYNGTKPWGGLILKGFDPAGNLKTAGGVASYIWFPEADNLRLKTGKYKITVIVDINKNLAELNEANNSLAKVLVCRAE